MLLQGSGSRLSGNRMIKYTKPAMAVAAVLVGLALATRWLERPLRTTQAFADHLYRERYEEAARMLRLPSALEVASDGGLIFVDKMGRSTAVPATKLPFVVGGHDAREFPYDFKMTALGSSTNGVLDTPAVTLYLSVDGGEVRIEGVES